MLRLLAARDVPAHALMFDEGSRLIVDGPVGPVQPAQGAVGHLDAELHVKHRAMRSQRAIGGPEVTSVLSGNRGKVTLPQDLVPCFCEIAAECPVDEGYRPVRAETADDFRLVLDDGPVELLTVGECFLRLAVFIELDFQQHVGDIELPGLIGNLFLEILLGEQQDPGGLLLGRDVQGREDDPCGDVGRINGGGAQEDIE